MTRPTRGGADSIRYATSSARPASMSVLDVDQEDPTVKPQGWFVFLLPTQTGVEMLPAGRYGYWEERPKIISESDLIIIGDIDNEDKKDEPVLIMTPINTHSVYIAQSQHMDAKPFPMPTQPREAA